MTVGAETDWMLRGLCRGVEPGDEVVRLAVQRAKASSSGFVDYTPVGLSVEQWRVWLFHPVERTLPRATEARHRDVIPKAICRACPVRAECLEHALAVREPYGIWGGLNENERRDIRMGRRQAS